MYGIDLLKVRLGNRLTVGTRAASQALEFPYSGLPNPCPVSSGAGQFLPAFGKPFSRRLRHYEEVG